MVKTFFWFLSCPDLTCDDLNYPDFTCPDLTCPDLTCLDSTCPDLKYPNLKCPNLTCPDFTFPNCTCPNLTSADLTCPDLTCPDMRKQSQLLLHPTKVELSLQVGVEFDKNGNGNEYDDDNELFIERGFPDTMESVISEIIKIEFANGNIEKDADIGIDWKKLDQLKKIRGMERRKMKRMQQHRRKSG